nr:helix-turn-helix domain-containing protein [Haloquadratum walsbyi]
MEFENVFYAADGDWIESLLVIPESPIDPEAMIESLSGVELLHFEQVSDDRNNQQTYRFNIVAHEPYPFLLGLLLREKSIPNRLVLTSDRFSGVATVAAWDDFRRLADKLQEQYGKFELLSVSQVETTGAPLGSGQLSRVVRNELSDDQLLILQVAYKMGYFDTPRTASADDVAAELDIAQSTFSERLRLAESELLGLAFSANKD